MIIFFFLLNFSVLYNCPGGSMSQVVGFYLTTHTSLSPKRRGFAPGCVNYKKRCTRLAAASDKVYQLLAHGGWFCPGTPASSTTKTDRHDIAEILLKVALNTINQIKSNRIYLCPQHNRYFSIIFFSYYDSSNYFHGYS